MSKIFFTYEQQLNKLQQEKGLIIPDIISATKTLEQLSYYSLIGGYKQLFKHTPSQNYKYGVTFDELVAFYYFDEELCSLFLKYILHIERHIKSLLSYYFCEKYSEQDIEYLNIQIINNQYAYGFGYQCAFRPSCALHGEPPDQGHADAGSTGCRQV